MQTEGCKFRQQDKSYRLREPRATSICGTLERYISRREQLILIIIEGIDRTGKSTLARRLAERLGTHTEIRHAGPPTRSSVEEYESSLNGYDPLDYKHLILDRFHVGEHVWPEIFERSSDMDDVGMKRHVDMFLESRGAVVVYGERDVEFLLEELVENNEPLHPHDLGKALDLFDRARKFSGRSCPTWNYEVDGDEKLNAIIDFARCKAERAIALWDLCGPGFVTGSLVPPFLLVGDEQGPKKDTRVEPDKVPFAPFPSTSGAYLMRNLDPWRHTMIVNSRDRDTGEPYDLKSIVSGLGDVKVVALGSLADKVLTEQRVRHVTVPHPQYWRRFHYGQNDQYANMITEGLEYV